MKVQYDEEVDALYLKLGDEKPDGVIEIAEGVNIDTTTEGKITGIVSFCNEYYRTFRIAIKEGKHLL